MHHFSLHPHPHISLLSFILYLRVVGIRYLACLTSGCATGAPLSAYILGLVKSRYRHFLHSHARIYSFLGQARN